MGCLRVGWYCGWRFGCGGGSWGDDCCFVGIGGFGGCGSCFVVVCGYVDCGV